jgi:type I restriction enzyme, S subunit
MELMNGYKQTDIGIIPNDWDVKELAQITKMVTNGFVGTAKIFYSENDNDVLYIQGYNVEENKFNFNGIKYVTKEFHKKNAKSRLEEGDLLTIQTGDVGLTTIVPIEIAGSNCHALIISRFKKDISNPLFFSYYFNSNSGRSRLKKIETGSTMKHINVGDLIQFKVPFPPTKSEQTAIATALSDMDALIDSLEKLIEKKKHIKQGFMQDLLRPKEGWVVKRLGDVADIYTGNKDNQNKVEDGEFPFFVRSQSVERINTFSYNGEAILIPGEGNIGKIFHYVNGKFDFHQRVYMISNFKEDFFAKYIYFYMRENFGKHAMKNSVKATVDSLRLPTFQNFEILCPQTVEEQKEISEILSNIETEINSFENKHNKYKMLKKGMMQELLTGKTRLI